VTGKADSAPGAGGGRADVRTAAGIFAGSLGLIAAAYVGSVALFAHLGVFLDPARPGGLDRTAIFNAALALVLAYSAAAAWLGQRWLVGEFDALRDVVEAGEAEWSTWSRRLRAPPRAALAACFAGGVAFGLGVNAASAWIRSSGNANWTGHVVWVWILNPLLFGVLGLLVYRSVDGRRIFAELGHRARVRLGDLATLAPFARAGLRLAVLWLLGSSLASLLFVEADVPAVVAGVLALTVGFGIASLLGPSSGVHARLRAEKRAELAWVRAEIARAAAALRTPEGGDAASAARLPALVAWEARVSAAPEWPIDTRTVIRFALFLLVPLCSWLGGALAERALDRWLG
jgi:hypothetical protein